MTGGFKYAGIVIATLVILLWGCNLFMLLSSPLDLSNPFSYLFILIQTHLYTGLFITAHDAMHGTIYPNRRVNLFFGQLCTFLYALFPYKRLYEKHHEHHRHVHTELDPDYHRGNFLSWYLKFIREYISWWQIAGMAILFNLLKLGFNEVNLILFWVLPSLLSTLQLFYFGTWLPHHGEHDNVHRSRSFRKNHLLAFLSCYFFGYHFEHHDSPGTPWWRLWALKKA